MQPGQTITPGSTPPPTERPPEPPAAEQAAPSVTVPANPVQEAQPQAEPTANWQYTDGNEVAADSSGQPQPTPTLQPLSWTASEYISHAKGFSWFALLGACLFVVVAVVYMLTGDIIASVGVGVAGIAFAVFSARPPRVLQYTITEQGVQIGQRFYSYHEFKSFSVMHDGPLPSVLLMPLKRFLPPITIFFEPQSGDAIIDALSSYLPHESKEPDAVDKLMSRIRF